MRCRKCGNEIKNVPEHLADLAEWVCQECTNAIPKRVAVPMSEETLQKRLEAQHRKKDAA